MKRKTLHCEKPSGSLSFQKAASFSGQEDVRRSERAGASMAGGWAGGPRFGAAALLTDAACCYFFFSSLQT